MQPALDIRVISQSARTDPWLVVIAASAGGIKALGTLLASLPNDLPAAIILVQHRPPTTKSYLAEILARKTKMLVVTAESGNRIVPGVVYVARPDLHLTVGRDRRLEYVDGARIRFLFSSANPLLETAAAAFGDHVVAVVLTGTGMDGTDGVQTVKAHGGLVIAQDRATSEHWNMPGAAIRSGAVDYVLPLNMIGVAISAIIHGRPIQGTVAAT